MVVNFDELGDRSKPLKLRVQSNDLAAFKKQRIRTG